MELQTISQVSKVFHLSTRALRYYEQLGLITSDTKEGYAYRVYDEENIRKIQQITILRKLRIPLKQIGEILKNEDATLLIDTFRQNLDEIDDEITALSTLREIIKNFLERLNERMEHPIQIHLLDDTELLEAVDSLTIQQMPLKEEKTSSDLQAASEKLNQLTDRDVRIIYLPPITVASIHMIGPSETGAPPEDRASAILDSFIADSNLEHLYPSARVFGFNNPDAVSDENPSHGYEFWVSIPDDMEVPAPLVKKTTKGGLYAAHHIAMGAFEEWPWLHDWVMNSKTYDFRWDAGDGVCGWLEEHLCYWDFHAEYEGKVQQLDLLIPVQVR